MIWLRHEPGVASAINFRNDDPNEDVLVTWKAHANLFYTNWVNYYVYQTTPYYLDKM